MKDFGYSVDILCPKRSDKLFLKNLISLCESYEINFVEGEGELENVINSYDLIIDSIFGYSFKGDIRQPFDKIIKVVIV